VTGRWALGWALLAGVASGCGILDLGADRRILVVHHHRAECVAVGIITCLLVREPGGHNLSFLYFGIERFEYEWGYVHEIEIEEHEVKNPPADGSSIRRVLHRVISKSRVPAGTEFDLVLTAAAEGIPEVAPGRYRILFDTEFACGPAVDCEALEASFGPTQRIHFRLAHAPEGQPLTLLAWDVCPGYGSAFVCEP